VAATFKLEIYTPYRLFCDDDAQAIVLRISDGEIGIYAGHSQFTAPVKTCVGRICGKDGVWKNAFIADGIVEVKKSKTVLLVDDAEWPEEVDVERAEAARKAALAALAENSFKFEQNAAKAKLNRAETRLKARGTADA
jgi:F-type H+-transporting ATPase subunit epsilon